MIITKSLYLTIIIDFYPAMDSNMNQNPEQIARNNIDQMLIEASWVAQLINNIDLSIEQGVAIREYQTGVGFAGYVLFEQLTLVGIIEMKREEEGMKIIEHEIQSQEYAIGKLEYLNNDSSPSISESQACISTIHRIVGEEIDDLEFPPFDVLERKNKIHQFFP